MAVLRSKSLPPFLPTYNSDSLPAPVGLETYNEGTDKRPNDVLNFRIEKFTAIPDPVV